MPGLALALWDMCPHRLAHDRHATHNTHEFMIRVYACLLSLKGKVMWEGDLAGMRTGRTE